MPDAWPYESALGTVPAIIGRANLDPGDSIGYRVIGQTAVIGQDVRAAEGRLTVTDRSTPLEFPLEIIDDDRPERAEYFLVELLDPRPASAALTNCRMQVWISDDDGPTMTFEDIRFVEGRSGEIREVQGVARLSEPTYRDALVDVFCTDDTALGWLPHLGDTAGYDYRCPGQIQVFFPLRTDTALFAMEVIGDRDVEGDERFTLRATDNIIDNGPYQASSSLYSRGRTGR